MKGDEFVEHIRSAPSTSRTNDEFQDWFNTSENVEISIKHGFTDFAHKIFTPDFYDRIGDPSSKVCCEIGFGGGRLLHPASCFFKLAHGIDIHREFKRTAEHLKAQGRENFCLHTMDEATDGSIADKSVDFVYSFITFQHFPSWSTAVKYIQFVKRVLTPSGCGIIYFGKNTWSEGVLLRIPDVITPRGFPAILYVTPDHAAAELRNVKLEPLETGAGTKAPWNKTPSIQFYTKFVNVP